MTTLRTAGSVEPYADLNLKRQIDAGALPGPHMDVTGPYLEGANSPFIQMHQLKDAAKTRAQDRRLLGRAGGDLVQGLYEHHPRRAEGGDRTRRIRRGLKLTGHLCSVTYPEAAAAFGIDNLEHGFWVNTQLDPGKTP